MRAPGAKSKDRSRSCELPDPAPAPGDLDSNCRSTGIWIWYAVFTRHPRIAAILSTFRRGSHARSFRTSKS
jgi:hypothetical protein